MVTSGRKVLNGNSRWNERRLEKQGFDYRGRNSVILWKYPYLIYSQARATKLPRINFVIPRRLEDLIPLYWIRLNVRNCTTALQRPLNRAGSRKEAFNILSVSLSNRAASPTIIVQTIIIISITSASAVTRLTLINCLFVLNTDEPFNVPHCRVYVTGMRVCIYMYKHASISSPAVQYWFPNF